MISPAIVERAASWRSILLGILLMIIGVAAIASPFAASLGATYVIAWLLIAVGITHVLSAWNSDSAASGVWEVLVGTLYFLVGLAILWHPLWGTMVLTAIVSAVLIAEGVVGVLAYFSAPTTSGDTIWTLLSSIITIFLGALILLRWPSSSVWVIGTLVGVNLLLVGTSRLLIASQARRLLKG